MRCPFRLVPFVAAAVATSGCTYGAMRSNRADLAAISHPSAANELRAISRSSDFNAHTDEAIDCIDASEELRDTLTRYDHVPSNDLGALNELRDRISNAAEKCAHRCGHVAQAPEALPRDRKIGAERAGPCQTAVEDHGLELIVASRMLSDAEDALSRNQELWGNMKLETAEYALSGWTSDERSKTGQRAELRERAAKLRTQFAASLGKVRSYLEDPEVGLIALRLRQLGESNPTFPSWASDRVARAAQTCVSSSDDFCRQLNAAMARVTPLRSLGAGEVEALYARLSVLDQQYEVK